MGYGNPVPLRDNDIMRVCYAYTEQARDKHGERKKWVCCPYCGNHAFYVWEETKIDNLPFKCKKSNCKKEFVIVV